MAGASQGKPATAEPLAYSQAVHDLALAGRSRAALDAFRAGAARWPRERISLLAWGNAEYAAGILDQAEKAFRQAARVKAKLEDAMKKAKDFKPDLDKKELENP